MSLAGALVFAAGFASLTYAGYPWGLFFWWFGSCIIIGARYALGVRYLAEPDQLDPPTPNIYDRRFRLLSLLNQCYLGSGIWLTLYYQRMDVAFLISIFQAMSAIVTVISIRGDLKSYILSMPLLFGQAITYWLWFAPANGTIMASAFSMLFVLTTMYARSMQRDFQENVTLNHNLAKSNAELVRSQKETQDALAATEAATQSKSFFLAAASHDLRQPIYAAALLQESLAAEANTGNNAATLNKLGEAIGNITHLLDDLLDLSRFEAGTIDVHQQEFPIQTLIDRIEKDYRPRIEAAGLQFLLSKDTSPVATDFTLALRLISNLVDNSIKYTAEGRVELHTQSVGDRLRFTVIDTGTGISEADQKTVFRDYVRLASGRQSSSRGVGLGLAIVRHISELIGCTIHLDSELGVGTRVSVDLPLAIASSSAT